MRAGLVTPSVPWPPRWMLNETTFSCVSELELIVKTAEASALTSVPLNALHFMHKLS